MESLAKQSEGDQSRDVLLLGSLNDEEFDELVIDLKARCPDHPMSKTREILCQSSSSLGTTGPPDIGVKMCWKV